MDTLGRHIRQTNRPIVVVVKQQILLRIGVPVPVGHVVRQVAVCLPIAPFEAVLAQLVRWLFRLVKVTFRYLRQVREEQV